MKSLNLNRLEFVKILYDSLQKSLRELEKNFITLLVQYISSLGVYVVGAYYFLNNFKKDFDTSVVILIGASFAAYLILAILRYSCNVFAYTYRAHQIVLSVIENRFNICGRYIPQKWCKLSHCQDNQKNNNRTRQENNNLLKRPDIYALFYRFATYVILITVLSDLFLIYFSYPYITYKSIIIFFIVFFVIIIIYLFLTGDSYPSVLKGLKSITKFSWPAYQTKINELLEDDFIKINTKKDSEHKTENH